MPHLQFEFNQSLAADDRERLSEWATEQYSETMETGTGHVAVTVRELEPTALSLGRAPAGDPVALLNADVRRGRSLDQRREFAQAAVDRFASWFDVPHEHCYVIYTEHDGPDFVLSEGPLDGWSDDEATDE